MPTNVATTIPPSISSSRRRLKVLFACLIIIFSVFQIHLYWKRRESELLHSLRRRDEVFIQDNVDENYITNELPPHFERVTTAYDDDNHHVKNNSSYPHNFLTIAIPTVPRPKNHDYLSHTLNTLIERFNSYRPNNNESIHFQIVVVNQRPGQHEIWEKNRLKFSSHSQKNSNHTISFRSSNSSSSSSSYATLTLTFMEADEKKKKKTSWTDEDRRLWRQTSHSRGPRPTVIQQTRDLSHFLKLVGNNNNNNHSNKIVLPSKHLLIIEDDFEACPHFFKALVHVINKANIRYGNKWLDIRISYGFNGIIFQNDNSDVQIIAGYLKKHEMRRPPDHLLPELLARETEEAKQLFPEAEQRITTSFRYNLLNHIGEISTLRSQKLWAMPKCFDELIHPIMFVVEAFDKKQCPTDDMWPCGKYANIGDDPPAMHLSN